MKTTLVLAVLFVSQFATAQYPENPSPNWLLSKKASITLASVHYAASIADAAIASQNRNSATCQESNPLLGSHPSAVRYFGQTLAFTTAIEGTAFLLRRRHHTRLATLAAAGIAGDTTAHAWGIASAARYCH